MRSHVYYYTHLAQPCAGAAEAFSADPGRWLPPPADPDEEGWLVELRADGVVPGPLAVQPAEVAVGPPERPGSALLRPVRWQGLRADRLFPVLDGDLELHELPGGGCQLSLTATYRPPLSVVGGLGDRVLGRRVAEACVRAFVLAVAERLPAVTLKE